MCWFDFTRSRATFHCCHLQFLPGWSSQTSSPSCYKNPQGLSYLLYMQAADELNQWLLAWLTLSLTTFVTEGWIFWQAHQHQSSVYLEAAGHLRQSLFFLDIYMQVHWIERGLDVCLAVIPHTSALVSLQGSWSLLQYYVHANGGHVYWCIYPHFEVCS